MDKFGLTEEEKQTNLQQYNHALFRNNMFFTDIEWEINMLTGMAVVMEDKLEPEKIHRQFVYADALSEYLDTGRFKDSDRALAEQYLSFENLQRLTDEVSLDLRVRGRADGSEYDHHRIVLTPAMDEEGQLYCVYMGVRDLQSEERRELALFHSQEQFRDALMSNSYFHFNFDVTGDGLIHENAATSTGYRPIEASTGMEIPVPYEYFVKRWYEEYQPQFEKQLEDDVFSIENLKRAFARNERLIDVEVKQTPPPGSGAGEYMQILVVLTEDPVTRHILACVIWRDISAIRRGAIETNLTLQSSNERLQSSNERLKTFNEDLRRTLSQEEQFRLASLSGALMVYNINLTRDLIEEEFYEIVDGERYPMLQLVGLTAPCSFEEFCSRWAERKVPEDCRENFLRVFSRRYLLDAYDRGEQVVEFEVDTVIGRGIPIALRSTALLLVDQESGDLIATVSGKDVTEQREEEHRRREALREAYEAANNANAAKSDFLARMSHDIRTPMNAIVGMTAIAQSHLDDRARVSDCLDKITVSSRHLLDLINDVLDMSKLESGKVELLEEAFTVSALVENLLTLCSPQIDAKGHTLSVTVRDIRHDRVLGDSRHIQQCFTNLMSNAIKYTPPGGLIRMTVTEKDTNRPRVGCYEFVFEDNGIGMTEEYRQHMFEPFSRARDSRVEKIQGTGLGLSITKNIVQMMNGTIEVQSELDRGTRVTVVIFLKLQEGDGVPEDEGAREAGAGEGRSSPLEALSRDDLHGRRALLVEDNELNAEIAMEILGVTGLAVERACNGCQAVEMISAAPDGYYDIVFMDIQMPEMNGYEATRAIRAMDREDARRLPILAMSANAFAEDVHLAKASGMNEHIAKPLDMDRLQRALSRWLKATPA